MFVRCVALSRFLLDTLRSAMLKTTAIEGVWSGETIVDLAVKVCCAV